MKQPITTEREAVDPAYHEFSECVDDYSMCRCGVPALTHDAVMDRYAPPGLRRCCWDGTHPGERCTRDAEGDGQ